MRSVQGASGATNRSETEIKPPPKRIKSSLPGLSFREQTRCAIGRAFAQGEMVARGINCRRVGDFPSTEYRYHAMPPAPRPGTLIHKGKRVGLTLNRDVYLGLFPVRELYTYKKDITSDFRDFVATRVRWLLPDRASLLEKIAEQDNRLDSQYPARTSGRIACSGQYVSGHDTRADSNECLLINEIILQGYRKEQCQCIIVRCHTSLNVLLHSLEKKFELEQELSIAELPVVFYEQESGSIRDIIFLSDFDINAGTLPLIQNNIATIEEFIAHSGAINLDRTLFLLPPARLLSFLRNLPPAVGEASQHFCSPYRDQLRAAVEQGDLDRVIALEKQGARLDATYYDRHGCLKNPLQLLLASPVVERLASDYRNKQPLITLTTLGKLLYDRGCRVELDQDVIRSLPQLAAYMITRGEHRWTVYPKRELFSIVIEYFTEGVIDKDELITITRAIQKHYGNDPKELQEIYTFGLRKRLFDNVSITDLSILTDDGLVLAECYREAIEVLASLGLVANTEGIKRSLQGSWDYERKKLLNNKEQDLAKLCSLQASIQEDKSRWAEYQDMYARGKLNIDREVLEEFLSITANDNDCDLILFGWSYDKGLYNPEEMQGKIGQLLNVDNLPEAEACVNRLYELQLQYVAKKYQAVETRLQELERIQECAESHSPCPPLATPESGVVPAPELQAGFGWLRQLFDYPPDTAGKSYSELAQLAIAHYYCTPHPNRVEQHAFSQKPSALLKSDHGPDHVTRTQLYATALLELFEKYDPDIKALLDGQPEYGELIRLAMVYHDVAAEAEPKAVEELRAAQYFERDMNAAGRYSPAAVALVAQALRNKESDRHTTVTPPCTDDSHCSREERSLRRILRLADRIDMVRATDIPLHWRQPQKGGIRDPYHFNPGYLDLPADMSGEFRQAFEALMEGAKDLAYVTGGEPLSDRSESGSYLQRYHLLSHNYKRRLKVARAVNAYDCVSSILDDNVRRKIAAEAGLLTCTADHTKESLLSGSRQASCVRHRSAASTCQSHIEYLSAIHSEKELSQISVPEAMTVLQKLSFEQQGPRHLPQQLKGTLKAQMVRLRREGIQPPLGTLTQKALTKEQVRKRLRLGYGLDVVSEERVCSREKSGKTEYKTFWITCPHDQGGRSRAQEQGLC